MTFYPCESDLHMTFQSHMSSDTFPSTAMVLVDADRPCTLANLWRMPSELELDLKLELLSHGHMEVFHTLQCGQKSNYPLHRRLNLYDGSTP